MNKRLIILDPVFSRGEGHHLTMNEILSESAANLGFGETILACASDSPFAKIADGRARTLRVFETSPYEVFQTGNLNDLARLNRAAYSDFQNVPDDAFEDGDLCVIHTINETQFVGMTKRLAAVLSLKDIRVRLAMMFPPGLEMRGSKVVGLSDPAAAMIFQLGARILEPFSDRVEWMGIGRNIAHDFSVLTGHPIAYGPAPVPNIGVTLPDKPPTDVPNIILYLGHAKFDKGFHHLPSLIRGLRRSDRPFCATVQITGRVIQTYPEMTRNVLNAIDGDTRFIAKTGRLSADEYAQIWRDAHLVVLNYDPEVYRRKSSGLCWEAMNYSVPAIVIRDTFHHREMEAYGLAPIVVDDYWPGSVITGLESALGEVASLVRDWQAGRDKFVDANSPDLFFSDNLKKTKGVRSPFNLDPYIEPWRRKAFEHGFAWAHRR